MLRVQCRAIARAAEAGAELFVMFPMIATVEDWRFAKSIWDAEATAIGAADRVKVGIMMEVPSVAVMARQFAATDVEFFSVGTNDLTSYILVMDRGHPKLAPQVDPGGLQSAGEPEAPPIARTEPMVAASLAFFQH